MKILINFKMHLKLSNTVSTVIYQRYLYRSLFSYQQNVNKTSSVYQTVNLKKINENRSSYSILSKHHCNTTLCCPATSLYVNFQKRNASSDASTVRHFEEPYSTSSQYATENVIPSEDITRDVTSNVMNSIWRISDWKIVEYAQNVLLQVHEITGLPWWASIMLTAIAAKSVVTFPFAIISMRNVAKLKYIESDLKSLGERYTKELSYAVHYHGWPESLAKKEYKKRMIKERNELIVAYNCHPAKSYILVLVQMPLWFAFSVAGRNLCNMLPHQDIAAQITLMELSVGGFGWVKNLAMFDPYLILPFAIGFVNITIVEFYNMWKLTPPTTFDRFKTNFFRVCTLVVIAAAANMPAAVNLYWFASSSFGLGQAFLMQSPRLRRLLGMPVELEHPYRHLYSSLKSRLHLGAA